ncbi:MAG: DegT/DnrJ/EryC1/StrS family aminotransferase [Opitutales bacterium]
MPRIYLSPPEISSGDREQVDAVLASNWVAPAGPHLEAFENAVAKRVGRDHAVALTSGTAALHLALQIAGVGPGDRVLCPTLTFAASANPILYCGGKPVFVDCEPDSWNMDPALLEQALQAGASNEAAAVKAVIVVHLYGQCADMDAIERLCREYGAPLIEDAAEALGASYKGRPAGSMGDMSFLSFNGNKIITTSGGGMLLANNREWVDLARHLATQAREPALHYEHERVGYNYRMSNVLAGLGHSQLHDLDRRIAVRREHFEVYRDALSVFPGVDFQPIASWGEPNHWLSTLTVDPDRAGISRDSIIETLAASEVEARPLWKPLHAQPVFREYERVGGACAERLFERGLCLPSGSGLTPEERGEVIAIVRSCLETGQAVAGKEHA